MELFVDEDFPPGPESLGSARLVSATQGWPRASELFPGGTLLEPIASSVVQSRHLNSCWFLSALSAVAEASPALLAGLVLESQPLRGRYAFRFYKVALGGWTRVEVDDTIPTDGDGNVLFSSSVSKLALWPCLFEKAYAKLHGSYHALNGGSVADALRDLTGGWVSTRELDCSESSAFDQQQAVLAELVGILAAGGMLGCSRFDASTSSDNALEVGSSEARIVASVTVAADQPPSQLLFRTDDDPVEVARAFLAEHGPAAANNNGATAAAEDSGAVEAIAQFVRGHQTAAIAHRQEQLASAASPGPAPPPCSAGGGPGIVSNHTYFIRSIEQAEDVSSPALLTLVNPWGSEDDDRLAPPLDSMAGAGSGGEGGGGGGGAFQLRAAEFFGSFNALTSCFPSVAMAAGHAAAAGGGPEELGGRGAVLGALCADLESPGGAACSRRLRAAETLTGEWRGPAVPADAGAADAAAGAAAGAEAAGGGAGGGGGEESVNVDGGLGLHGSWLAATQFVLCVRPRASAGVGGGAGAGVGRRSSRCG